MTVADASFTLADRANENQSVCCEATAHGPANMAVVRHFAFNLLRSTDDTRSLKLRRKRAARNNQYLQQILQPSLR